MFTDGYRTKSLLPREGTLILKCKVSSIYGSSDETGRATAINVKMGRRFMLSKALTQCVFGHLKKLDANAFQYLANNSGDSDFVDSIQLNVTIKDFVYEYKSFQGRYGYKTINVKGKRYVQVWEQKNGRYYFSSRKRVDYDKKDSLEDIKNQVGVL